MLRAARGAVWHAVNSAMVTTYWEIGRIIVEKEQEGQEKAQYGKGLIKNLAVRLAADFGKGFSAPNLWDMRSLYLAYPILQALPRELSWTHYRILLRVTKPEARAFYEKEAINARWSTRELERQISSLLYERLALSRDKSGMLALVHRGRNESMIK